MKLNIKTASLLSLFASTAFAKSDFFGDVKRAEIFEKTDFVLPKFKITLSDEDYKNFKLRYECDIDTNLYTLKRNDKCYKAPWIDLDEIIKKSMDLKYINKNSLEQDDLMTINNGNITFTDFEKIVSKYSTISFENHFSPSYGIIKSPAELDIKVEGKMTFDLEGEIINVPKIEFSIGGNNAKKYKKLSYNIKVKKGELLGRKQIRLRPYTIDPSFLREKLGNDIANAAGLKSLSSNFGQVYINDIYMGLYGFRDIYKSHWIEAEYGEKSTQNLYACGTDSNKNDYFNCKNNDEKITDMTDFNDFIKKLSNVTKKEDNKEQGRKELDEFFDTKTFLKWNAIKSLYYAWDNLNNGHNSYLYKTKEGIWTQMVYDFDNSFGSLFDYIIPQMEYYDQSPLLSYLDIYNDNKEYKEILSEVLEKAFNPKKLIPYIDKLVAFLAPYVKEDRTPDANGNRPGRFDRPFSFIENEYTYDDFINNCEYTMIKKVEDDERKDNIYGLKQWILEKFLYICELYELDCSYAKDYAENLLSQAKMDVKDYGYKEHGGCGGTEYNCCVKRYSKDELNTWQIEFNKFCLVPECWSTQYNYECCKNDDTPLVEPLNKSKPGNEWYGIENSKWCGVRFYPFEKEKECWSSIFGYPCCELESTKPRTEDKYLPNKFYGIENGHWCGIVDYNSCNTFDGFKCCSGCEVKYTDDDGDWGIENNNWCHIPAVCNLKK